MISQPNNKPQLLEDITKLRDNARDVNALFKSIIAELSGIHKTNWLHPRLRPAVQDLQSAWTKHHKTFQDYLWQSREIAGKAQAVVTDFIVVFLPRLYDPAIPLETKREELQAYDDIVAQHDSAQEITRKFVELKDSIQASALRWGELKDHYKGVIKKDDKVTKITSKLSDRLGDIVADSFIGKGVQYILRLLSPLWEAAVEGVSRLFGAGNPEELVMSEKLPSDQLIVKLAAICNVWAAIRTDLQSASIHLRDLGSSQTTPFFAARLEQTIDLYQPLAEALMQYQISVAYDDVLLTA